ncbi:hypothetical protein JTB14_014686 [Gonioctena quinquepunctata]|nr:hypothetical protein JTB14_014686 [Gonioctena quinquepunctata]
MGIESSGVKVTADSIKTKLLQDISVVTGSDKKSVAMYGASSSKLKGKDKMSSESYRNMSKGVRCYNCNQYGHFASQCNKKRDNKFKNRSGNNSALFSVNNKNDAWYLDSGCSAHMTASCEILQDKRKSTKLTITTANNEEMSTDIMENKKGSTLLEKKKEDAVKEKDLFCFPEQEPSEPTRKDSEKADLEERNEVEISEPENGSSNGYVDVISDVDVNQNDPHYLPKIELGEENAPPVQRNQRVRRAPEAMKDYVTYSAMVETDGDPLTVEDALSRPDKDKWFQAMQNEYDALIQNATWDLVDLPPEKRPLNCKSTHIINSWKMIVIANF